MDLSSATAGQQRIITTLDAPLSVAAGAGSGKTFTLTNRIGYALLGSDQVKPCIESIDELLATTFSKAGAEEMKSRIRSLLRDEGLDDQARLVDDAWITTIHGVCSRILREHALELGIDPAFEVVEDVRVRELWTRALDTTLRDLAEGDENARLRKLLAWYPESGGPRGAGLSKLLPTVWEKAQGLPKGFESIHLVAPSLDLSRALRTMIELGERYRQIACEWEAVPAVWDEIKAREKGYIEALERALDGAQAYLQRVDLKGVSFADEQFDMMGYLETLLAFPKTSKTAYKKMPDADFFEHYRQTYADIAYEVMAEAAVSVAADLVALTRLVDQAYQRLKGPSSLDNADLLRLCCQALEDHPELRASYQERFKLIMVDEFQDTDLLQVAIIDQLSRDHGANVMTVGDAQQSLYRFRGADVEVFFQHRALQQQTHPSLQALSLPDNFRSHGDILKFVDAIFARPTFFGDEFLSLAPRGKVNDTCDPLFEEDQRVSMAVIDAHGKAGIADARARAAAQIAEHFARLRDRGAAPSDMVVLLGGMSNAKTYSQALEEAGFESIVAGGSVFAQASEVKLIEALLAAAADPLNSTALYQVLASPLFNLSDAVFFALARFELPAKSPVGRSFAKRFWSLVDLHGREGFKAVAELLSPFALPVADLDECARVLGLFSSLVQDLRRQNYHEGIQGLLLRSGWLYRLQTAGAEGLSVVGNLHKALAIISDWQRECRTLPQIACDFSDLLDVSKQSPGVLSTADPNFVRIMTIHSSKGLEFKHVAVSEVPFGTPKTSKLALETFGDTILLAPKPPLPQKLSDAYRDLRAWREDDEEREPPIDFADVSATQVIDLLDTRNKQGALADAERLLYVALTRAVDSLYLCLPFKGDKDFKYEGKGILGSLHEVFGWERSCDAQTVAFDYGGTKPALISHEVLLEKDEIAPSEGGQVGEFALVPAHEVPACAFELAPPRADVISYSSIAPDHGHDGEDEGAASEDFAGAGHSAGVRDDDMRLPEEDPLDLAADEMFPDDIAALIKQQSATALGTAFHRLAQRAIESRQGIGVVPVLPESAFEAQVSANDLAPDQAMRLQEAMARWLASGLCARFMGYDRIFAEVPFMITLATEAGTIFLEGEIDGLALGGSEGEDQALFIDYKTGGSDAESEEGLHDKHLLQAQCYALALIRQGFDSVEANFIRVERTRLDDPSQPQVVTYSFTASDAPALEAAVLSAYRAHEG